MYWSKSATLLPRETNHVNFQRKSRSLYKKNQKLNPTQISSLAPSMAEADWSELPKDLLNLISQRLDNDLDLIRFRSVCSNWHSSSLPNHLKILPFKFPLLKFSNTDIIDIDSINNKDNTSFCYLSKNTIFLVKPKQQQHEQTLLPWLIRIVQSSIGKTQLHHPLTLTVSRDPFHFPHVLDLNKFSLLHLGCMFTVDDNFPDSSPFNFMYLEKVAIVTRQGKNPIVLGKVTYAPQPPLLKCGDENWKVIPDMSIEFGDICLFKGRIYVVDKSGRTVMVGPDNSNIHLVADPLVDGGDIKFLVEREGELLLVDIYECFCFEFPGPDAIRVDVFKLDEKEKKWVKLTTLGDSVLFVGNECSFSASASDLCVPRGNCVVFIDVYFKNMWCGNCVFHLDQDRFSPLSDCPEYLNLFWPPPEWIVKSCLCN